MPVRSFTLTLLLAMAPRLVPALAAEDVTPRLECTLEDVATPGKRLALFGYENPTPAAITIEVGPDNQITIDTQGASAVMGQPTTFAPGIHPVAFAVRFTPGDAVSWSVRSQTASVTATSPSCDTGPDGPAGPPGPAGPIGDEGPEGREGDRGSSGATGAPGRIGDEGPIGEVGLQGRPGPEGRRGETGPEGPTGAKGDTGPAGARGATGAEGEPGGPGAQGAKGPTGGAGPAGAAGPAGQRGTQGAPGPQGPRGAAGPIGPKGAGLSFVAQVLDRDAAIVLPPGNASVVALVSTGGRDVTARLPTAASARGRFIRVRRVDSGHRVFVVPDTGDSVTGATRDALTLAGRLEGVTFVSDGTRWVVFEDR
jgi:hypothetical protein